MIKTLLSYFGPHKKIFMADMFCAFMVAAIDLAFPLVSRRCMYDLLPDKKYQAFFTVMAIVAVAYVLRAFAQYVMTYWGHTFGVRVEADIRRDLFYHFQDLDFEFYDQNRTGNLMNRLTGDLFEITELSHHGPEDVLISTLTIIGSLIFMFWMEWRLALVIAILLPIFILIVIKNRKNMSRSSANVKKRMADINAEIESRLSGVRTSKAFANEDVDKERFDDSNELFKGAKNEFYRAMGIFFASQEFFMCIMPVAVIAFGGYLIMEGRMNYVDLITFTLFVSTFVTPIRKLSNFAEIFTSGTAGLKRFMEVMAIQPVVKEKEGAGDLIVTEGSVKLHNVSFSYNGIKEVLRGIDLDVRPGEIVAIVGHSGGGKTTLCQLIPRFYDVTEGSITIDGTDVRDVTKRSIRQNVGIVQQDVFIFADTILENIRYGRPDATYEEVVEAAKRAEIYDDIMDMPDQFETYVGERGTKLSGGQKQRVSIARIFLKDPKILILDEATSALDTITEEKIQESFEELAKGRTTIVIAHRLSTVKDADRIVVIEDGLIVEEGSHEELLAKNGEYAKLYNV
ncbi:MAG: ABC transporter ATP-binding protein [Firmicutes bacterium]|nr:ABC transporter ATP-binding protein [Bacillota bacterium]